MSLGHKQLRGPDGKPVKIHQDFAHALEDNQKALEYQHFETTARIKQGIEQQRRKVTSPIGAAY